jgi:hypothetical protein
MTSEQIPYINMKPPRSAATVETIESTLINYRIIKQVQIEILNEPVLVVIL